MTIRETFDRNGNNWEDRRTYEREQAKKFKEGIHIGRPAFFINPDVMKKAWEFVRSKPELYKRVDTHNHDAIESKGAIILRAIAHYSNCKQNNIHYFAENCNRKIALNKTVNDYINEFIN